MRDRWLVFKTFALAGLSGLRDVPPRHWPHTIKVVLRVAWNCSRNRDRLTVTLGREIDRERLEQ